MISSDDLADSPVDAEFTIICRWDQVTTRLVIASSRSGRLMGIVAGTDRASVLLKLCDILAAQRMRGPQQRDDWFPDTTIRKIKISQKHTLLGGQISVPEGLKILSAQPFLRVVCAHSDGVDIKLSPVVICSALSGNRNLSCVRQQWCHRLGQELRISFYDQRLQPVYALASRVLILHVCNAFVPNHQNQAKDKSLAKMAYALPGVAVVIAIIGATPSNNLIPLHIANSLYSGFTIAQSLAEAKVRFPQYNLSNYIVLGNIDFHGPIDSSRIKSSARVAKLVIQKAGTTPFPFSAIPHSVRALFEGCLRRLEAAKDENALREFTRTISSWSQRSLRGKAACVAFAIRMFGTLPSRQWSISIPQESLLPEIEPCPWCKGTALRQTFRVSNSATDIGRSLLNCPLCGIVSDQSYDLSFAVTITNTRIHIKSAALVQRYAVFTIWEDKFTARMTINEPAGETPAHLADQISFDIPKHKQAGVFAICFSSHNDFAVVRYPHYILKTTS